MTIWISEVDGTAYAELLNEMNSRQPDLFPPLTPKHLADGHWWIATVDGRAAIGFAGMVPMHPFVGYAYMKRAYVHPGYRGRGIQMEFMRRREQKAVRLGYSAMVGECSASNAASRRNFERAGFVKCEPEQCWGQLGSVYFVKRIA